MKPLAMGIMQKHNQCAKSGGFAEIDALCFDWRSLLWLTLFAPLPRTQRTSWPLVEREQASHTDRDRQKETKKPLRIPFAMTTLGQLTSLRPWPLKEIRKEEAVTHQKYIFPNFSGLSLL